MTSTSPTTDASSFALSSRILCGSLMGALVFIGIALFFVLGTESTPPLWVPLAQLAAGVVVHLVVEAMGYRPQPLDRSAGDEAAASAARTRWQSAMILRFALIEAIAIVSIAAAFVIDGGVWTYVVGALVSLVLMLIHVWPGARSINRTATALEAQGQQSFLRETFGIASPGPMQLS